MVPRIVAHVHRSYGITHKTGNVHDKPVLRHLHRRRHEPERLFAPVHGPVGGRHLLPDRSSMATIHAVGIINVHLDLLVLVCRRFVLGRFWTILQLVS